MSSVIIKNRITCYALLISTVCSYIPIVFYQSLGEFYLLKLKSMPWELRTLTHFPLYTSYLLIIIAVRYNIILSRQNTNFKLIKRFSIPIIGFSIVMLVILNIILLRVDEWF